MGRYVPVRHAQTLTEAKQATQKYLHGQKKQDRHIPLGYARALIFPKERSEEIRSLLLPLGHAQTLTKQGNEES